MSIGAEQVQGNEGVGEVAPQANTIPMSTAAAERAATSWGNTSSVLEKLYAGGDEEETAGNETDAEPAGVQPPAESSRPLSPSSPPSTAGGGLESPPAGSGMDPVAEALLRSTGSADPAEAARARRALSAYLSDGNQQAAPAAPAVQEEPPVPVKDRSTRVDELYNQLFEGLKTDPRNKTVRIRVTPDPDSDSYDKMKEEEQITYLKDPDNPLVQEQLRLRAELEIERQMREESEASRAEMLRREESKRTVETFETTIAQVARKGLNVGEQGVTSADWFKKADGTLSEKRVGMFKNNVRALLSDQSEFQKRVAEGVRAGHFALPNTASDSIKIAVRLAFGDFTEEFSPYKAAPSAPSSAAPAPPVAKEVTDGQSAKMPVRAMGPSSASAAAPSQGGQSPIGGDGKPVPRGKWDSLEDIVSRALAKNNV